MSFVANRFVSWLVKRPNRAAELADNKMGEDLMDVDAMLEAAFEKKGVRFQFWLVLYIC